MVAEIPALTVKKIKGLKLKANVDSGSKAGGRAFEPDGTVGGLGIRYGAGDKKVFVLRGRVKGSPKTYRWTLGQFVENPISASFEPLAETPLITLAQARQKAEAYLNCAKAGVDPDDLIKQTKAKAKEAALEEERARQAEHVRQVKNSFGNVVESFLKAKDPEGRGGHKVRPKTFYDYQRILRGGDFAEWRTKPIDTITRRDVREIMRGIEERASNASSHLAFAVLRSLFNWARDEDILEITPTADMKAPKKPASRDRVLSDLELKIAFEAMGEADKNFAIPYRLLALTAARESEILAVRASEIHDLAGAAPYISIGKARAKTKTRYFTPLCGMAADLMRAAMEAKLEKSDLVFSTNGETPISGISKAKTRLDKMIAKRLEEMKAKAKAKDDRAMAEDLNRCFLEPWVIHDLRRTAATGMAKLEIPPHIIEAALNHAVQGVAGIYNHHPYEQEVRQALGRWCAHVDSLLHPNKERAKVIPLHGKAS